MLTTVLFLYLWFKLLYALQCNQKLSYHTLTTVLFLYLWFKLLYALQCNQKLSYHTPFRSNCRETTTNEPARFLKQSFQGFCYCSPPVQVCNEMLHKQHRPLLKLIKQYCNSTTLQSWQLIRCSVFNKSVRLSCLY